jgi:hypothetical protein
MSDSIVISKTQKGDVAHTLVRAGIGSIPVLGTVILELIPLRPNLLGLLD